MRLVFMGLPLAACLLAHDGHEIAFAALSRDGAPGARRLRRILGPDRVLARPRLDDAFLDRVRAAAPDLVVSWFWTSLVPMDVVRAARLGGIGVHPSLLPRHRGPDPTTWAILAGDAITGVTCHLLDAEYDTGAILAQERLAIDPAWNAWQLARALDRPSLRLLRRTCAAYARGEPPPPVPQDGALATAAPFLEDDDLVLRWDVPAEAIVRKVRALAPSPGAFTAIGEAEVAVLAARAVPAPPWLERAGEAASHGGRALVRAADGAVELLVVEREGEALSGGDLERLFRCKTR